MTARDWLGRPIRWVRGSYPYRWLTAEPEPEVVVIDLRELYVIGPLVGLVDATLEFLVDAWWNSAAARLLGTLADAVLDAPIRAASLVVLAAAVVGLPLQFVLGTGTDVTAVGLVALAVLAVLGTRIETPWSELRETRTVRLLAAAFEPPPPPEGFEATGDAAPGTPEPVAVDAPTDDAPSDGSESTDDAPTDDAPTDDTPTDDAPTDDAPSDEPEPTDADAGADDDASVPTESEP